MLLTTKFLRPTTDARAVRRDRLSTRLAPGGSKRLNLVIAPAGYGKTTLVSRDAADARSGAGLATADDLWLVAFCTPWCAFCQQLSPVWEDLARELRHEASVAWWDVDQPGGPPTAIGGGQIGYVSIESG